MIRSTTCIATVLSLFASACVTEAEEEPSPPATPSNELVARARELLDGVRGTGMAPGWEAARLSGQVTTLYRPDISGPAYVEMEILPAGFIILSTGDHDHPIAHWNFEGESPTDALRAQAAADGGTAVRFYKLDSLTYAAEDAGGELVATLGALPMKLSARELEGTTGATYEQVWLPDADDAATGELVVRDVDGDVVARHVIGAGETAPVTFTTDVHPFASWDALKAEYADAFRHQLDNLKAEVRQPPRDPEAAALFTSPFEWNYHWADGGHASQRLYEQMAAWSPPNARPCYSGCGATAWAMLFGWADYEAATGNPKWQNHWGIYRANGGYGANAVAPAANDAGIRSVMMDLSIYIKTFCSGGQGATAPWDMGGAQHYLQNRDYSLVYTTFNSLGISDYGLFSTARNVITQQKMPVIIGTGWFTHYPLAYGYAWKLESNGALNPWFYVNQGWGGTDNGWIPASTWFTGQILWLP